MSWVKSSLVCEACKEVSYYVPYLTLIIPLSLISHKQWVCTLHGKVVSKIQAKIFHGCAWFIKWNSSTGSYSLNITRSCLVT